MRDTGELRGENEGVAKRCAGNAGQIWGIVEIRVRVRGDVASNSKGESEKSGDFLGEFE